MSDNAERRQQTADFRTKDQHRRCGVVGIVRCSSSLGPPSTVVSFFHKSCGSQQPHWQLGSAPLLQEYWASDVPQKEMGNDAKDEEG